MEQQQFTAEAERRAGRPLGPGEVDRFWYREALERAAQADPGFAPTHSFLGPSLERTGRPDRARQACGRARALDPELEDARAALERLGYAGDRERP